jgi:hypothetical protein
MFYWPEDVLIMKSKPGNKTKIITELDSFVTTFQSPRSLVPKPSLWGTEGVRPMGAKQGSIGDCWFIAAAAAIAENPERIQKIFVNQGFTTSGIFRFRMFYKGFTKAFNIDDRLGVNHLGKPFSTKESVGHAWWMPLLEKAYAKFNVNYLNLQSGGQY